MKRKISAIVLLLLMVSTASALEAEVRSSGDTNYGCQVDEEPVISLNSTDGGHAAEPGYFGNTLCVSGDEYFDIKQGCGRGNQVFSLFNETNSHISLYSSYTHNVCAPRTQSKVANTCDEGIAALSVESDNNTHVADPGVLDKQLCFFQEPLENITLQLSGLSGTFTTGTDSEDELSTGDTVRLADYPYIVVESGSTVSGIVSYSDFVKLSRPSDDTASLTQTGGSFLVPQTSGAADTIERREQLVSSRRFTQSLDSSFSFPIPENPTSKIALQPEQNFTGFTDTLRNSIEITVTNKGLQNGHLMIDLEG